MRTLHGKLICLFLAALLCGAIICKADDAVCRTAHPVASATVHGYLFRTYSNENEQQGCLKIFHQGKLVYSMAGDMVGYSLGLPAQPEYKIPGVANGTDLTGSGYPEMVVTGWSGGAHCCQSRYVFVLAPVIHLAIELDDGDSELSHFVRLPNGHYDYSTSDETFAYWNACFACSPMPSVMLAFATESGKTVAHLDLARMHKPAPTAVEWQKSLRTARKALHEQNPAADDPIFRTIDPAMWGEMLHYIYTGRAPLAWKLVDASWPVNKPGKEAFLAAICGNLGKSVFWRELSASAEGQPPACTHAAEEK